MFYNNKYFIKGINMPFEIKILKAGDERDLKDVASWAFDNPIDKRALEDILNNNRQHIAVAVDQGVLVGFASAIVYNGPEKPAPELWINEIIVAEHSQYQEIGKALMRELQKLALELNVSKAYIN